MGRETFSWPERIFNGGGDFFIVLTSLPPEDFSWGRLFNVTPAFVLRMRRRKHELASVDEGH